MLLGLSVRRRAIPLHEVIGLVGADDVRLLAIAADVAKLYAASRQESRLLYQARSMNRKLVVFPDAMFHHGFRLGLYHFAAIPFPATAGALRV